jgi:glycerol kinase
MAMPPRGHILAIDQGTTSTRAILFDVEGTARASANRELRQHYPHPGWVEHDPEQIWQDTITVVRAVLEKAGITPARVSAIGIANQRETTVLWDRKSGKPIANAIVWQDRRTAEICTRLRLGGHEGDIQKRTGLLIDPYFSATKIAWLLDNTEGARKRAEAGELAFGTIDTFLMWRLTGGHVHVTDATNASRTMLFNLNRQDWDEDLLSLFRVPHEILPEVHDCAGEFGTTEPDLFGGPIAIRGILGDQQAAVFGQCCFSPGMVKCTFGTGCFALVNTGDTAVFSQNKLLTTIAYRLDGQPTFAVEGSIFNAGAAVQWLRDGLQLIDSASATADLAAAANAESQVYLVPAFTGLGSPHWDSEARGAIFGLTRDTGPAEIARATLEAVCYQTRDLFLAMAHDGTKPPNVIRVDGGFAGNDWAMQFLADILGLIVERAEVEETTALGAAMLAGMRAGVSPGLDGLSVRWRCKQRFTPKMTNHVRDEKYTGWLNAVERTLTRTA